jgi:hypothetical protein
MPPFNIVKTWAPDTSFRTQLIKSQFTLQDIKLQKHPALYPARRSLIPRRDRLHLKSNQDTRRNLRSNRGRFRVRH